IPGPQRTQGYSGPPLVLARVLTESLGIYGIRSTGRLSVTQSDRVPTGGTTAGSARLTNFLLVRGWTQPRSVAVDQRARDQQRIYPIEDSRVARNERARVLDRRGTLEQRLGQIPELTENAASQRSPHRVGQRD